MLLPRIKLVNIGDKLTYIDSKDKIVREDILRRKKIDLSINKQNVVFENKPLSGWKIQLNYSVDMGHICIEPHFLLKNKELDVSISIRYSRMINLFPLLKIDNGVIKNKILLLVGSTYFSIDIEGSKTYEDNLKLYNLFLNNEDSTISKKDLKVGNVVMLKNQYNIKESIYLGSAYMMHFRAFTDEDKLEIGEKAEKFHFFIGMQNYLGIGNDYRKSKIIISIKDSAVKDIILLDNSELNIKYTDILKNFYIDKTYPLLEGFENLCTVNTKAKYYHNYLIGDSKNDEIFSNKDKIRKHLLKVYPKQLSDNFTIIKILPNVEVHNEIALF